MKDCFVKVVLYLFFFSPGQFDGWQRQMNAPRPPPGQNQYSLMNKGPRSPLLNPQAEPWRFGNQQNMPQNQPLNSQVCFSFFFFNCNVIS